MDYQEKLKFLSLGQGQGSAAVQLIKEAIKTGSWICLQNCHLSVARLVNLEKLVDTLESKQSIGKVHPNFRLWLTTMPTSTLPESVLQRSLKVCFEPPVGLKANLQRIYLDLGTKFDSVKHKSWKKLLFGLALFHGILNERKKYFPLTFSHLYDWSSADLSISISMLKDYLDEQKNVLDFERKANDSIQFTALRYLVGDIIYGGRVVDQLDLTTIGSLLRRYINEEVVQEKFYFREIGTYTFFPDDANLTFYKSHIQSLQLIETPELFGLHANAEKKRQHMESKYLLSNVISLQSTYSNPEEKVEVVVSSLIQQLKPIIPGKLTMPKFEKEPTSPLQQVLKQEIQLYNALLSTINASLLKLESALEGKILLYGELEQMFNEIARKSVPNLWLESSYPTVKPLLNFIEDLCERVMFFRRWLQVGQPPVFMLPYFFHPKRFLTSVLQLHSRRHQISIDNLTFKINICDFHLDERTITAPNSGVYVYGAVIEGESISSLLANETRRVMGQ
jgi:dynein heavy chain